MPVFHTTFRYLLWKRYFGQVWLRCHDGALVLLLCQFLSRPMLPSFSCASVLFFFVNFALFWEHIALPRIARICQYLEPTRWAKPSLKTQAQTTGLLFIVIFCLTIAWRLRLLQLIGAWLNELRVATSSDVIRQNCGCSEGKYSLTESGLRFEGF